MNKYLRLFIYLLLLTGVIYLLAVPPKVQAQIKGKATNELPNNYYWQNGASDGHKASLVVAHGGMEGPDLLAFMYFPFTGSTPTTRVTIENACDDDFPSDVNGSLATTTYYFLNASQLSNISGGGYNTGTINTGNGGYWIECTSGGDLSFDVNVKSNEYVHKINIGGVVKQYKVILFFASASSSGGRDYENQFRLLNSNPEVLETYVSSDVQPNYFTGLYNRSPRISGCNRNNGQCYWSTSVAFGVPCGSNANVNFEFKDNDAEPGNYQGVYKIKYNIWAYPNNGGPRVNIKTGQLTGGNNQNESIGNVPINDQNSYELELWDIYIRNSIQVRIPISQIWGNGNCGSAAPTSPPPAPGRQPECGDNVDNDGDGQVDASDLCCHTDNNAGNGSSYNRFIVDERCTEPPPTDKCPPIQVFNGTPGGATVTDAGVGTRVCSSGLEDV